MNKDKGKDKDKRSLYDEALARFRKEASEKHSSPKDTELLNEFLRERATPEETKQAAELLQADAGKKYGTHKLGDVEIPGDWIDNIMANIEYFVAAGDFVTKNAPESVGMAWYAVKLTLTAIHSNYDLYTFFGSGLSDVSEIMIFVRHYDRLYDERSNPQWKPSPLVEKLLQDVISAYAAVLDFSFAIKRHLTAGALTRIKHGFKDFFGLSRQKFEDKLGKVAALKKVILEESAAAFQDKTLTQLQSVSTVLASIEGTVRHIRDFQDTQKKLHEEAMAKFDTLIKGLEDIKASTKRKTHWDYCLSDFQAFQKDLDPLEGSFDALGNIIDSIYPGTCQWVFEDRLYKEWQDSATNAILCVTGPEGSGKSCVLASVAHRIIDAAVSERLLLYVTCSSSASGLGLSSSQSYTADSICRTLLSQLYNFAVQGEDNIGLLEACNSVFKKAKERVNGLPSYMRGENTGLPEFTDGFSRIACLLKKSLIVVVDGLDRNTMDDKNQEELLRKLQSLMRALSEETGVRLHILVGCGTATRFFNELDPSGDWSIDVGFGNREDMKCVLTNALKDIAGLSDAEREEAKNWILEKAGSRFVYLLDTAIPFMREPFQRPLSRRLEALPGGITDTYKTALSKMSPNYLELLRTALTWTLLSRDFPYVREVMDSFQGIYDIPAETDTPEGADGFPPTSRLELEQLREATDPFLKLFNSDGRMQIYRSDPVAVTEFFFKSGSDIQEASQNHEHLCARCGLTRSPTKLLQVDPKQGHLQMALTCLRHLNHPLFQRRAGLATTAKKADGDADNKKADPGDGTQEGSDGRDREQVESQASSEGEAGERDLIQEAQDGYQTEGSLDDEDVIEPQFEHMDQGSDDDDESDDSYPIRVRYEIQFWPWHIREAEALWTAEERKESPEWAALMSELDKLVFDTPEVFDAWQRMYPEKQDRDGFFMGADGYFTVSDGDHKPLHVAATLGLTSWTTHLLNRGEELNGLSHGFSPLQAAACAEDGLETMRLLLDAGSDVNAENGVGRSAFQQWFMCGDITVEGVQMLLEHKADPHVTSSLYHYNALQYFASRGEDPEILELLLGRGADINAVHPEDPYRLPPLHILLIRREVPGPLLEAFIKHGADLHSENAASVRPLQIICTGGQRENLKIILQSEGLDIDDIDFHGTTAVHEAAFYDYSDVVRTLLEHNADPDITDKVNRVALHTAARMGFPDTVRVLLEHTKQVNSLDNAGWSPLFCACLSKNQEAASLILDALIERDLPLAEINKRTRSGRTVLRQAADHGFDGVVSKLIRLASDRNDPSSLNIDARDTKKGMTALHRAAMNGHAACVHALLSAKPPADVSLTDAHSRTALALAYERWSIANQTSSYEEIISALIAASPADATADADLVAVCAANGSVTLLTQLWRLNADLKRPDRFGWTPLDLARHFHHKEAEVFLKQRAARADLLPSRWETTFPSTTPAGAGSVVSDEDGGNGRRVLHTSGKRVCVSADRPLPADLEGYYFEVTLQPLPAGVQSKAEWPEMAVGFCTLGGAALEFPGWWAASDSPSTARSWGYHSDTGGVYSSVSDKEGFEDVVFEKYRYAVGDTVGCGVDLGKGEIWFTRNGERLDSVVVTGVEGRLFPVVGLHDPVCFETNFGREGDKPFTWPQPAPAVGEKVMKGDGGAEGKDAAVVKVVVRGDHGMGAEGEAGKMEVRVASEEVVVVDVAA
ncbi:ankyrin-3 [Achaetomium macrosporum]|uniref:Ankyrin-3 n=1 Tax=Achaetomium macrosporum TaxID=79813 RepID=A0AAN7HEA9_9PEZI|nr:ankyrin-3 [Achaetomium macrosporum]